MKKVTMKPLGDRVLVRPAKAEEKTSTGIIIPDTAKEKPAKGEVLAIGKGKTDDKGVCIPMEVKVGDVVLYGKYSGTEVKGDEEDLLMMHESDILATCL